MEQYARLNRKEWKGIVTTTDAEYKKLLGNMPTTNTVRTMVDNPYSINSLQYVAMFLLAVLAIYTGFKVGAIAIPFSNSLLDHLTNHAPISTGVYTAFNGVTFLLFWLLSTPGLIYFKLLSHDERIVRQRENTANYVWYHMVSLEYISPRLPSVMTYIIMAWLLLVSNTGDGTIFEKFIPVFAELALAQLVGDIIEQNAAYSRVVADRLKIEQDAYTQRLKNRRDPERVLILSGTMTEVMTNIVRDGKRPNAFLEKADKSVIKDVLKTEYERLSSADNFVEEIEGRLTPREIKTKPILHTIETPKPRTKRMVPPKGAKTWDKDTMLHALQVMGANPQEYNERSIKQDFAPNYNATGVWRKFVRKEFTGAK